MEAVKIAQQLRPAIEVAAQLLLSAGGRGVIKVEAEVLATLVAASRNERARRVAQAKRRAKKVGR